MQDEFTKNYPSLNVSILAINERGQESANGLATTDRSLPLLQDVDANADGTSDIWTSWNAAWRDVRIVDKNNNLRTDPDPQNPIYNLTSHSLADPANYAYLKARIITAADRVAANAWQSPIEPLDVDNNGIIAPLDALLVINDLGKYANGVLPGVPSGTTPSAYVDVTGDGVIAPLDALLVINQLSRNSASAAGRSVDADSEDTASVLDDGLVSQAPAVASFPWTSKPAALVTRNTRGLDALWVDEIFATP